MKKSQVTQLLAGLFVGAVLGWSGVQLGRSIHLAIPASTPADKITGAAIILFAAWFALAFHELAHLTTGLWQGFRFHLYVAGFLGVRRHPETDRVQWYFNTDPRLFGGVAATLPRAESPDLTIRFARMVIAGPLSSLLLALAGGLGGWLLTGSTVTAWRLVALFLLGTAVVSFFLFLATTVPSRTGMFFTDRARYFRLISGGKTAEVERAMLELIAFVQSGKPMEQMNLANIKLGRQDATYAYFAEFYAFFHYLATEKHEEALAASDQMSRLPEDMPPAFRAEFLKEVCFAAAFLKKDADAANDWWKKIEKQLAKREDVPVLRLKAALCRVNGDLAGAQRLVYQALAKLEKKQLPQGSAHLEQRLLRDLAREGLSN